MTCTQTLLAENRRTKERVQVRQLFGNSEQLRFVSSALMHIGVEYFVYIKQKEPKHFAMSIFAFQAAVTHTGTLSPCYAVDRHSAIYFGPNQPFVQPNRCTVFYVKYLILYSVVIKPVSN